jgi:hypothetical protein
LRGNAARSNKLASKDSRFFSIQARGMEFDAVKAILAMAIEVSLVLPISNSQ